MSSPKFVLGVCAVVSLASCVADDSAASLKVAPSSGSVWTIDLVQTLPGQQAEYMRSVEANWASARSIARDQAVVLSYRALVAKPDSGRGWDIILMTEYADSAASSDREAIFKKIFSSPDFVYTASPVPSSELRKFSVSGLEMREFVSE